MILFPLFWYISHTHPFSFPFLICYLFLCPGVAQIKKTTLLVWLNFSYIVSMYISYATYFYPFCPVTKLIALSRFGGWRDAAKEEGGVDWYCDGGGVKKVEPMLDEDQTELIVLGFGGLWEIIWLCADRNWWPSVNWRGEVEKEGDIDWWCCGGGYKKDEPLLDDGWMGELMLAVADCGR